MPISSNHSVARILRYYELTYRLKDLIRTGWQRWYVQRERLESVAEHVFGTQMLAIAIWSEFQYDVDIQKVCFMLALHELEEITIGDHIPFGDISEAEKYYRPDLSWSQLWCSVNHDRIGYDDNFMAILLSASGLDTV